MSEEEIIEENIRRYIKEHSTTIKAYTQKYVDDLQNQLQQKGKEIERLKQDNEYLNKVNIELSSRNTKAIEYIKEHTILYTSYLGKPKVVPKIELQREAYDKLLEILKGSDKE